MGKPEDYTAPEPVVAFLAAKYIRKSQILVILSNILVDYLGFLGTVNVLLVLDFSIKARYSSK